MGTPYWMAPEMITESGYNELADIWSIGIVCIELYEGVPPLYSMPAVRAMFMIPKLPPHQLDNPKNNVKIKTFNEFMMKCLEKNVDKRPSAAELLKHKYLAKLEKSEYSKFAKYVKESYSISIEDNIDIQTVVFNAQFLNKNFFSTLIRSFFYR